MVCNHLRICADVTSNLEAPALSLSSGRLESISVVLLEEEIAILDFRTFRSCSARRDELPDFFL